MYTEDDTFRILSRMPIGEAYIEIQKKLLLGFATSQDTFNELVNSYGYTYDEYCNYDKTLNF